MNPIRVGQGFDIHPFSDDASTTLVLGGVTFAGERGLVGHSDSDVIAHACADALLGAAALGDIGTHFPDTDASLAGADSIALLATVARRVRDAGVPIVLGTDAGNPLTLHGPSVFVELEAMAAAGLTAGEVLRAATADAADALGRPDLGRVRAGAIADLVVLAEDPLADVRNLRTITHVVRAGVLHRRESLRFR